MRLVLKGVALAALLVLPAIAQDQPRARVAQGELAGFRDRGADVFLNIPFGTAPVGALRWKAPAPPPAWKGVRDAAKFGPACMQSDAQPQAPWSIEYFVAGPYSEDCLSLNVWTTAKPGAGQAVALFVPGGGFNQGGGGVPIYNGANMAKAGIIFVTMNYRLSAAGFLTHHALTAEAGHSGNYGLTDVIAALIWIRENIVAFGGDPAKVTVMGQSAGAGAINALLRSPQAKGLFRAAIVDSGVRVGPPLPTSAEREAAATEWAASKGATNLAQLRALPVQTLAWTRGTPRFAPTTDGHVVPAGPVVSDVPILTGWNKGEGATLPGKLLTSPVSRAEFEAWANSQMAADAKDFLALYPSGEDARTTSHMAGHDALMMGTASWAAARTARAPVYLFDFEHVMPGAEAEGYGSYHSSELPYVFDTLHTLNRPWTDNDRKVSSILQAYWVNFIKTGDPNGGSLPRWAPFDRARNDAMALGLTSGMRAITDKADFFRRANAKFAAP
jgi:para-nitrobenzyl esterase